MVLFRAHDSLDVFGPLDILQLLARSFPLNLFLLLARTLDPVSTQPAAAGMNPFNSSFWPTINPTHTFGDFNPEDLDFVKQAFPKVKHFITICTGSGIAARAGPPLIKSAWTTITAMGPDVKWVSPARWVVDGKIRSSSGVSPPPPPSGVCIGDSRNGPHLRLHPDHLIITEYQPVTDSRWDP
ncbi:DJ-1/PfpI family protein [Diplogelasinospora grovesii]|uniref:DJ-1/PfpI family protein n=1 Tax=Diplogelasinospora grovesii TaxID=303347 RepID=A0AAN6NEA1_9PEZI|nr:DJ-1/PfpI family protein [Diplogelasinospora grovesii]